MIGAAMSLRECAPQIEAHYEAERPTVDVVMNLAGSQTLAAQILAGAAVDVFLSANAAQLQRLVAADLAGPPRAFASNHLVAIASLTSGLQSPADLGREGLKIVLAAPEVPAGAYAREALDLMGLREPVIRNLVSEEDNVRAILHKVRLGEADAGIVYATDLRAVPPGSVIAIDLAAARSIRATYYATVLRRSGEPERAAAFVDQLFTPATQRVLAEFGFGPSSIAP